MFSRRAEEGVDASIEDVRASNAVDSGGTKMMHPGDSFVPRIRYWDRYRSTAHSYFVWPPIPNALAWSLSSRPARALISSLCLLSERYAWQQPKIEFQGCPRGRDCLNMEGLTGIYYTCVLCVAVR